MSNQEQNPVIAWQAPEFTYVEKTADWYWIVGMAGILIAAGAYYIGNWSFALLIVISTVTLIFLSRRQPEIVDVELGPKTITLNHKNYYLKKFDTFNIDRERSKLLLHASSTYRPIIVVPLATGVDTDQISQILENDHDMEINEELHEPVIEMILHHWGF